MTDLERFDLIDEVRRVCDQQECPYAGDSWTRENLAWIFAKARARILFEDMCRAWDECEKGK
jgi:hypothetical protein